MNGMYLVTLVFQFAPGNLKVGVSVTSRYNFQCHVCKNLIQIHLYNVKETCAYTFGSKLATGYRSVSCRDTSRYNFQRYIFQNKINTIGHDVNG